MKAWTGEFKSFAQFDRSERRIPHLLALHVATAPSKDCFVGYGRSRSPRNTLTWDVKIGYFLHFSVALAAGRTSCQNKFGIHNENPKNGISSSGYKVFPFETTTGNDMNMNVVT